MNWLNPAILQALLAALLLSIVYVYLYTREGEKTLLSWAIVWSVQTLSFLAQPALVATIFSKRAVLLEVGLDAIGGWILLRAMGQCLNKRVSRKYFFPFLAAALWAGIADLAQKPFLYTLLPMVVLIGGLYIWSGVSFLVGNRRIGFVRWLTGLAFILMGLIRLDVLLMGNGDSVAIVVIETFLMLAGATGILLLFLERKAEENSKWARVFQYSGWGIFATEEGNENINLMNPAFAAMHGYRLDELPGTQALDFLSPEEKIVFTENDRKGVQPAHRKFETYHRRKDGSVFPALVEMSTILDQDRRAFNIVHVQDITVLRQREIEQTILLSIFNTLRYMETLDELYAVVDENILRLFGASQSAILLLDVHEEKLECAHCSGCVDPVIKFNVPLQESFGKKVLEYREPLQIENKAEFLISRGDDHIRSSYLLGVPLVCRERGAGVLWVARDAKFTPSETGLLNTIAEVVATGMQQMEMRENIQDQMRRLNAMRSIDEAITAGMNLPAIFQVFLEKVRENLGVNGVVVFLFDDENEMLRPISSIGFTISDLRAIPVSLGGGLVGYCARKRICSYSKLDEENILQDDLDQFCIQRDLPFRFCVPMVTKNELKGVVMVCNNKPLGRDEQWKGFVQSLAAQAAIAVENVQHTIELQSSHFKLETAYHTTLEGWAKALELRDNETEGHSRRVTEMTLRIAMELGFTSEELVDIRRGALLHDIGKMGIPDSILHKPGPLNEEEWAIMRQHPQFAMDLLSTIDYLQSALEIPYCHHEKWDGSGYPRGLKGEEIPLSARIFAVVDVWDALCSDRPYRQAWPEEKVLAYIREETGKQFDPMVVKVFLKAVRDDAVFKEIEFHITSEL